MKDLKKIKYFVIDVDGTMTDGGIYYDEHGNEQKKFCTKDAAGFFCAQRVGIKIVILTGRECAATSRRMKEMNVDFLFQNVKDKKKFLKEFMKKNNIYKEDMGYIGDDINDFETMKLTGFVGCPADSCTEILECADYISEKNGGYGAVRDVIEYVLRRRSEWNQAVANVYGAGC